MLYIDLSEKAILLIEKESKRDANGDIIKEFIGNDHGFDLFRYYDTKDGIIEEFVRIGDFDITKCLRHGRFTYSKVY